MALKRKQIFLAVIVFIFTFLLVYSPHFNYPYPFHVDEWHHIAEAKKLISGQYQRGAFSLELGFHLLLAPLAEFTNLVLVYKFLPALWAVFSALALFYVVYQKTSKNFWPALLSIIFFASIKSDVNITGLWFFTPLTFSLPLIFLYFYFFSEGVARQNKKFILTSFLIMIFLLPIHAISVLFAWPILLIYSLIYWRYFLKEYKFFLLFLFIPVFGLLFYKFNFNLSWSELTAHIFNQIQFKYGWGILELKNSFTSVYSWLGYLLAIVGVIFIISSHHLKKYAIYLLWPAFTLLLIIIFRLAGISYLSPYQRNLYYFAISLPILSAIGLYSIIITGQNYFRKLSLPFITLIQKKYLEIFIVIIIVVFAGLLTFQNYYQISRQVSLYQVIDDNDYQALVFLARQPKGVVGTDLFISTAVYPVSGNQPFASLTFDGSTFRRQEIKNFFLTHNCETLNKITAAAAKVHKMKYIIGKKPINCGWPLIYQKNTYIYQIDE